MSSLWQNATVADRAHLVGACLVAILIVSGFGVQRYRGGDSSHLRNAVSMRSPEVHLVAIQLGHRPGPANGTLRHFALLLDILEADCPADTRQGLADLTTRTLSKLRRGGIPSTPNQILGGVVGAVDIGSRSECSSFFERYVTLRRDGADASH